jgi:hypothetical protein
MLVILGGLFSCSSAPSPGPPNSDTAAIQAYADPATQATLEGLSSDNLAKYTQFGNSQFKAAVTQELIDKVSGQINSQLGSFVSVTFLSTEEQGGYQIVHYRAKYSKGDVGVRMVFDKDHLVAGQFFE